MSPWAWAATIAFVIALIGWDLWKHRRPHVETVSESLRSTILWTLLGLAFTIPVWLLGDSAEGVQYFTGYVLERSLSIDNVFVFVVILAYFAVPPKLQHHALLWGVVVALFLRAIFILAGAALIERFSFTLAIFGVILIITAINLARNKGDDHVEPDNNIALKLLRKITPVSDNYNGTKMTIIENGKRIATPMLAVLLVIGSTDLLFAVDSVPAVYGVTTIPFIVFAANAFSLMGLRPMASLLAGVMDRFIYLQAGLAIVLALVGTKMIADVAFDLHLPVYIPLVAIIGIIGGSMWLSLLKTKNLPKTAHDAEMEEATRADKD